LLIEEKLNFHS